MLPSPLPLAPGSASLAEQRPTGWRLSARRARGDRLRSCATSLTRPSVKWVASRSVISTRHGSTLPVLAWCSHDRFVERSALALEKPARDAACATHADA